MSRSAKNGSNSKKSKNRKFPKRFNFWPWGVAHRLDGRDLDEEWASDRLRSNEALGSNEAEGSPESDGSPQAQEA